MTVLGYDEVLERLKDLHAALSSPPSPEADLAEARDHEVHV